MGIDGGPASILQLWKAAGTVRELLSVLCATTLKNCDTFKRIFSGQRNRELRPDRGKIFCKYDRDHI